MAASFTAGALADMSCTTSPRQSAFVRFVLLRRLPLSLVLGVVFGCGSTAERSASSEALRSEVHEAHPVTQSDREPEPDAPARQPATGIAPCSAPETPELTSYLEVHAGDGVTRHLKVLRDPNNGVWATDSHIRMPMHHATAIRWTNLDDYPRLTEAGPARLRFAFTILTRDTRQVPGQRAWRTEYTAEVSSVCEVSED